ncbi:MAG: diguanylate cyclase [Nitrospirae bacterium]|nr:diguanylate cyclase [Nitrospirota bacterium]MBF0553297.1 diguanylate cyclase [Nitrospirota bacterium]
MIGKHVILCCNYFRQEIESLNISKTYSHVKVVFFPGRCGQPPIASEELSSTVLGQMEYDFIDVLSGSCCVTGLNTHAEILKPFHIHGRWQCFHMIANPDIVEHYTTKGRYVVTPGWLSHWRQLINLWGFNQETAQQYFSESSTGILLLDTGVDTNAYRNLQEFSDFIDRPHEAMLVGLGFLDLFVTNIILQRQIENRQSESHSLVEKKQKVLSHYAMALDLLRTLTQVQSESDVIQQIADIFTMLFAPQTVSFNLVQSSTSPAENHIIRLDNGFVLPISSNGKLLGMLEIDGLQFPEYMENYLNLASGMVDVCGMAINNARHYQEIKDISNTDGLTGIANRRKFDEHLNLEWKRMTREQKTLSVIMCDVDYFKGYNDTYGHITGDDCLRQVAKVLSSHCRRPGDLVARYGGEEFVLVLSDTQVDGAFFLAERIRQSIEKLCIPHADSPINPCITLSIGVSYCVPTAVLLAQTLVQYADYALYEAKSNGRNRIMVKALTGEG